MEWTSTLLVKYSEFRASFTQPTGLVTAYQVDFCKEVNPKRDKNDGFIAPGQEYREIFKKKLLEIYLAIVSTLNCIAKWGNSTLYPGNDQSM